MFKTEIKNFTVTIGEDSYSASAPTSVFSLLTENGEITNPYYRDEEEKRFAALRSECEIKASFTLSSDAAKLRFAYIKIPDLDTEAQIIFNNKPAFKLLGARSHKLDVSGLAVQGENTLVIKVSESSVPRDITILESVEFFAFSKAHISAVYAKPMIASEGVNVDVCVDLLGDGSDIKAVATLISPSGKIYYGGVTNGRTLINIPDPLLWWPAGYGVQNLYKLTVNLYYENEAIDSAEARLGLRSLFHDGRRGVGFTVNGVQFFAMGAEYKMDGKMPTLSHYSRASALVNAAASANMNFISFNGMGRYPCDAFLDLCDSLGIAVEYVLGGERLQSLNENTLRRELADNFIRLSKHPSVISFAYEKSSLGEARKAIIDEARAAALCSVFVRQLEDDDIFEAEVSIPEKKTLSSICVDEDMNIFSYVMERHMESPEAVSKMLSAASGSYKYANGMDELTYMSGILQAHSDERFTDLAREQRHTRGSAVVSSLTEVSPSVSHAMIDFNGGFKAPYYLSKQAFAPVRLIIKRTAAASLSFILSNESKKSFSGIIEYTLKDAINNPVYSSKARIGAEKYSVSAPVSIELSEQLISCEREYYLEYSLHGDSGKISSGAYLFVPPKHFKFADPVILSEISGSGREFTLTVRASAFAKDVIFRFENTDAVFDNNCIDITDTSVRRLAFVTSRAMSAEQLMAELRVMSVYNIGRNN